MEKIEECLRRLANGETPEGGDLELQKVLGVFQGRVTKKDGKWIALETVRRRKLK